MPKPLEVYEELKGKIGEKGAATKEDIHLLKEDIHQLKVESATKEDVRRLETKIEAVKSDLLKEIAAFTSGSLDFG